VNEIANQYSQIQSAIAGAERVFAIMDESPEPADAPGASALGTVKGSVVFSDVSFSYDPATPVLTHVSLEAAPGAPSPWWAPRARARPRSSISLPVSTTSTGAPSSSTGVTSAR